MATNHTENYELNQWLATDPVLRADFNADNAKIEAALSALEGRNCGLYTLTYTGTGSGGQSFTFPHKPILVVIMGGEATWMCGVQGVPFLYLRYSGNTSGMPDATWTGNTLSWSEVPGSPTMSGNIKGSKYFLVALMDLEQ